MRLSIFLLTALLVFGCSSKSVQPDAAEVIKKIGLITVKQDSSRDEIEQDSGVRTSVYGSVSTGGRVSIGIGFLLTPLFSGDSETDPVRYEIDLQDGGQITIYHQSRDFEVDDCVEITVYPNEAENPPTMKRKPGAC